MLRRTLIALCLLSTITGCSREEPTETPRCDGFRHQCVAEAALGAQFGCARLRDRTVWCWGRNDQGQLGYATSELCPVDVDQGKTRAVACHTFPMRVPDLADVTAIESGDAFSCALVGDGTVRCWGANAHGELGNGKTITSQTPAVVEGVSHATALAVGPRHACTVTDRGVVCWGANESGQLGARETGSCPTDDGKGAACATRAIALPFDLGNIVALAAGGSHTCALSQDGRVTCWGDNRWGQLGVGSSGAPVPQESPSDGGVADSGVADGAAIGALRPVHVTPTRPLSAVVAISAGADHTCAVRDGGDVYCWGRDDHNQLGAPPPQSMMEICPGPCSDLAVKVPNLPGVIEAPVDAGADGGDAGGDASVSDASASEASVSDASDSDAEPSDSAVDDANDEPPRVGAFGRQLSSGHSYTCLRVGDGTIRCWGENTLGQLGDGRSTTEPGGATMVIASPGAATNNPLQGVTTIAAGAWSACALIADNSLRCWGTNQSGALGAGHYTPQQGPVPVTW